MVHGEQARVGRKSWPPPHKCAAWAIRGSSTAQLSALGANNARAVAATIATTRRSVPHYHLPEAKGAARLLDPCAAACLCSSGLHR